MPLSNPQDLIVVKNIDTDCSDISSDVVKTTKLIVDEEGNRATEYGEHAEEWSHDEGFRVKWEGQWFNIPPGESKVFPRFLAEHYAKYLADHSLAKRNKPENSITERPKVLAEILIKIQQYFNAEPETTAGEAVVAQVSALNEPTTNLGEIPNPAVGVLKPEPQPLAELTKDLPKEEEPEDASIFDENKPWPSKKKLIETAYGLGIELTGKENKAALVSKIKAAA